MSEEVRKAVAEALDNTLLFPGDPLEAADELLSFLRKTGFEVTKRRTVERVPFDIEPGG